MPYDKPFQITVCHCNYCKARSTGLYTVVAVFFPKPGAPYTTYLTADNPKLSIFNRPSDSGNSVTRLSCKECRTEIASLPGPGTPQMWVTAPVGSIINFDWELLKDKDLMLHCWTKRAVMPVFPDGARQFEAEPSFDDMLASGLKIPDELMALLAQ